MKRNPKEVEEKRGGGTKAARPAAGLEARPAKSASQPAGTRGHSSSLYLRFVVYEMFETCFCGLFFSVPRFGFVAPLGQREVVVGSESTRAIPAPCPRLAKPFARVDSLDALLDSADPGPNMKKIVRPMSGLSCHPPRLGRRLANIMSRRLSIFIRRQNTYSILQLLGTTVLAVLSDRMEGGGR